MPLVLKMKQSPTMVAQGKQGVVALLVMATVSGQRAQLELALSARTPPELDLPTRNLQEPFLDLPASRARR